MNILSEIIDLLSSIFIPATFVAMVIHTNKLVTRKKLSNALRFFVLTGVFFPIVSIGIWVYAIYAKPGNRDQRLRYRLIPNILAGTVLSGALLFLIVLIMSMDATHSDEIPVKEIDFNKMQENLGIKFDPQNATVDTAFFDNFFRSSDSFYKLRLNDEENAEFTSQIKKTPDFVFQHDTAYQVAQIIESWPKSGFTESYDSKGNRPGHWIQKNDSIFILNKREPIYTHEIATEALYNSNNGELYYNFSIAN
jgi:hypothetical protein